MRPRLFLLLAILTTLTGAAFFILKNPDDSNRAAPLIEQLKDSSRALETTIKTIEQEISTPPPLRGPLDRSAGTLTITGVLAETNRHRAAENVPALVSNATLNQAAATKLADMFAQQYFEHISPTGQGPAEVADNAGYTYLRVGENLALGNFDSDAALVQAWMESPGHRANIVDTSFTELGVAVSQGTFEGQQTWLAVQTFGLPRSACPTLDQTVQTQFTTQKAAVEKQQAELKILAEEFNKLSEESNTKIAEGNSKIEQGNQLAKDGAPQEEVQPLWDAGKRLQQEGQQLVEQAKDKQSTYNNKADTIRELNAKTGALAEQLNAQINAYNNCLKKLE